LPLFTWWHQHVDFFVDLPYLPAGSGDKFGLEHWPLYCVLTMMLGEILDVARYGLHRGKLSRLCQGSYVFSTQTKQNLCINRHFIWNSKDNHTSWHDN
jgi:hypothetical protein